MVGNFGRNLWRAKNSNNIAPYAYGNPANLFNNEPIAENFLRRDYPGMGTIRYLTTDEETLNYNSMQVSVQRRLHRGLQMGMAYTLSKAEGMQGYDYGPPPITSAQITAQTGASRSDRRHNLVLNYSYAIPNPTANIPILKQVLGGWEAAGVTQFTSGNPLDPICGTNLGGVANIDPSLSGLFIAGSNNNVNGRCELTGEPIFSGFTRDPNLAEEDQMHFNLNAFRRPLPNGKVGNLGNASSACCAILAIRTGTSRCLAASESARARTCGCRFRCTTCSTRWSSSR